MVFDWTPLFGSRRRSDRIDRAPRSIVTATAELIYIDHDATTRLALEVREAMLAHRTSVGQEPHGILPVAGMGVVPVQTMRIQIT